MKPLSERDENSVVIINPNLPADTVGMKPLSERDENSTHQSNGVWCQINCRNEATLWKRWELDLGNFVKPLLLLFVGMKPLSERDENT